MTSNATLPVISFIIPAYNAAKTIRAALVSVLEQSYPGPIELSVFDDCSSDETSDIVLGLLPLAGSSWPGPRSILLTRAAEVG